MQFLTEVIALLVLYLLFRQGVVLWFPVRPVPAEISSESRVAVQRYRRRYLFLLWSAATGLTFITYFALLLGFFAFHYAGGFTQVMIIQKISLWIPALIAGFLGSSYLAPWLNQKVQTDGLSFFMEGYTEGIHGYNKKKVKKWSLVLAPAGFAVIVFLQAGVYLKHDGQRIYYSLGWGKEKVWKKEDVTITYEKEKNHFIIAGPDGERADMEKFSGNTEEFILTFQ